MQEFFSILVYNCYEDFRDIKSSVDQLVFQFRVPSWIKPWTGQQPVFKRVIISQMNVEAIGRTILFECLYRLNWEFISILDFCTNKHSTQCVFLCAPILTESNNHF